jgi:hypothetical protein
MNDHQSGFAAGYDARIAVTDIKVVVMPQCPYALRTEERRLYMLGWAKGCSLAILHLMERGEQIADLSTPEAP